MSPADSKPFAGIPVKITNNTTVPLDIYDVFNPATQGQAEPYTYTKLGSVPVGATGTVTTIRRATLLEAMYTGGIKELQNRYYHQFPVKLMSGTQFSFGNPPPLAYTVSEGDRLSMIESFRFHKFAMANPDSALTTALNAALQAGKPDSAAAFFAGTENFKNCTLGSWNAVMTWLRMFLSAWQGPYYLYESAPKDPPKGYVPVLVGTLVVTSADSNDSATLTLHTVDDKGAPKPASPTSAVAMAGDGTMTDKNPGQDVTLKLTPVWMNTIQTDMVDGKSTTSYLAGPTLTGTVAESKVVSTQTLLPTTAAGVSEKSAASLLTFSNLCQVVGLIVGLYMLYEMVGKNLTGTETEAEDAKAEATSESEYDEKIESLDAQSARESADIISAAENTISSDASGVAEGYAKTSQIQQREVMTETLESELESMEHNAEQVVNERVQDALPPDSAFEDAITSLQDAQEQISDGALAKAATTMKSAGASLKKVTAESTTTAEEALNKSAEAVQEAGERALELKTAQDNYEKDTSSETKDSGFPEEDATPEVEEAEIA